MSWLPDWLTGYDAANAQKAAAADATLQQLNAEQAAAYGPDWYAQVGQDYATQATFGVDAQHAQIDAAAAQGINQGASNVKGFIGNIFGFVGKALGAVLLGIPFWAWALGVLALLWWLGVLPSLVRKVKGQFA